MTSANDLRDLVGSTAYDRSGDRIGKIGQIYYDDDTDQPKWVTVQTGLFGTRESFVPVQDAEIGGDRVTVAYEKAIVKDAPRIAEDGHLSPQEEEQLYRHYGIEYSPDQAAGTAGDRHTRRDRDGDGVHDDKADTAVGRDMSGPTTDYAMTRSEEQLRVGTATHEAGRARLRKHVVTERHDVQLPVSRDVIRVEREPITDANRGDAHDGPAISDEEQEVVLREERPVVDTEAVPVERVRLGTDTVTEQQIVGGEVRKEEIDIDDTVSREKPHR
jgi:uncharacterized protein (TIGR02271 family)